MRDADASYAESALGAAQGAWPEWSRTPEPEPAAILRALADRIRSRSAELADLMVAEVGKPITEAEASWAARRDS